jgi:DNA-binding IclR family transcriptional regulator
VIVLPCVSADGKPTKSGIATLTALKSGALTPEAIAEATGNALFRVRSGLRELVKAGFVKQVDDNYQLTMEGNELVP